jgi:tetratricopeptide (TPR) repeat protein
MDVMKKRLLALMGSALLLFVFVLAATAQEWRGMGRVGGKVVDEESGKPIEGVTVKAMLPTSQNRGPESKSNGKGEWAIGGVANGNWSIDFTKDGYETRSITVQISESGRIPPMEIKMKKKAAPVADSTAVIQAQLVKAASLMNEKKFAEARAIYADLAAKYPDLKQFRPLIARTYHGEGNKTAAADQLRKALEQDPTNIELKLLLGTTLMELGKADEARTMLSAVDESKIIDPAVFINIGIGLINERKHADAVPWFDKAIARFPQHADSYYYRGISFVTLGKAAEAKADLEKFVSMASPDAPELATAKQILTSIK